MRVYYYDRLGTDMRSFLVQEAVVKAEQGLNTLYLAPSREVIFAVRDAIEQIQGGIMHIQVGGMEDLEKHLLVNAESRRRLDQSTTQRLIQHILRTNHDKEPYQFLAGTADQEGLARLLADQIKRAKRYNLTPTELTQHLNEARLPEEKLAFWSLLQTVYLEYQTMLQAAGLWDVDDISLSAARVDTVPDSRLPDFLVLDGYFNVDPVHRALLARLLELKPGLDCVAAVPFYTEAGDSFIMQEIIQDLTGLGFEPGTPAAPFSMLPMAAADLAANLFDLDAPQVQAIDAVRFLDAPCRADEVRQVLQQVRDLLMSGQTAPHRIALVVRDLLEYQDDLAVIASEYSIPLQLTRMQPLDNTHSGKDLLRILAGLCLVVEQEERVDTVLLGRTQQGEQALAWLEAYWPEAEKPAAYCQMLLQGLERAGTAKVLTELFFNGSIEAEWLQREMSALQVLQTMLTDMSYAFSLLPDTAVETAQDFYLTVTREMAERSVPGLRPLGGVRVLDPDLLRGVPYDHIFFMGLNEGVFPRTGTQDLFSTPVFTGTAVLPMVDAAWEVEREKLRFVLVCAAARTSLTLSYRTAEEDGSFVLPSPFLQDAAQLLGYEPGAKRSMRQRFQTAPDQIRSLEELLQWWTFSKANPALETMLTATDFPGQNLQQRIQKIRHGAGVEMRRFSRNEPDEYDGSLAGLLLAQQSPDFPFSASQLNDFQLCPFRYYAGRILGLVRAEDEDEITPLFLGNLYHRVLAAYYTREPDSLTLQKDILADCLTESMAELSRFGYNRLFLSAKRREIAEQLHDFLLSDLEIRLGFHNQTGGQLRPTYLEWSIDNSLVVPGCRLRANVDRVDLEYVDGAPTGRYVIYDYKRKSIKTLRDILKGEDLQLPVYALLSQPAVSGELGMPAECMGALFYSISKKERKGFYRDDWRQQLGFSTRSRGIHASQWDLLLQGFSKRIRTMAGSIRSGAFTLPRHCSLQGDFVPFHCDFEPMCRYDAERLTRKGGADSAE